MICPRCGRPASGMHCKPKPRLATSGYEMHPTCDLGVCRRCGEEGTEVVFDRRGRLWFERKETR